MEEQLIEKVRSRVFLYDIKVPEYRDNKLRSNAWKEIGKELKMKPRNAKDIWDRLRRCFMNALNRRRLRKSGEDVGKKLFPWRYEEKMSFLLPSLDSIYTQGFLTEEIQNESRGNTADDTESLINVCDNSDDETIISNDEYLLNENPLQRNRDENEFSNIKTRSKTRSMKRKRDEGETSITQVEEDSVVGQIKHDERKLSNHELDETDMFFLSLAKTTKTLPAVEQAKVKLQISQTILKAQIADEEAYRLTSLSSSSSSASYVPTTSSLISSHFAPPTDSYYSLYEKPSTVTYASDYFKSSINSSQNQLNLWGTQQY